MRYVYRAVPALLTPILAVWAWGFSENPPDGLMGAPGEGTCANTGCSLTTGDVNGSRAINSADIIYLVNYVLRGGSEPLPCTMVGDVNCNGSVTTSDLIEMTNIVFRGAYAWCDVCNLWALGRWRCPALEGG